jgi:hypothetical protein
VIRVVLSVSVDVVVVGNVVAVVEGVGISGIVVEPVSADC